MRTSLVICFGLVRLVVSAQTTTTVTTEAQLRAAISTATPGDTIILGTDITLSADLPSIATALTINGGGHAISGNNQFRGLTIANASSAAAPFSVNVQDLSITNAVAGRRRWRQRWAGW